MKTSKRVALQPGDKITSLTHIIIYKGIENQSHIIDFEDFVHGIRNFKMFPTHFFPQLSLEHIEESLNFKVYGGKLYRGMQIVDLIDHDKYMKLQEEEEEN